MFRKNSDWAVYGLGLMIALAILGGRRRGLVFACAMGISARGSAFR